MISVAISAILKQDSDKNEDNVEEIMADHIFEEHAEEIIMKAIQLQFTVKHSEKKQTSLQTYKNGKKTT